MAPIVPILLAAGASSRMGRPKPLCDFDGRTALELALSTYREAALSRMLVVLGHAREEILQKVPPRDYDPVINEHPEHGQTSSLLCALRKLPPDAAAFLIHPVDYPLIGPEEVRRVVEAFRKEQMDGGAKRIFIPSYSLRRGHPVLVDSALRRDFEGMAADRPIRSEIHRHAALIRHVDMPSPHVLMDMDTPDEYDRCLAEYRKTR